VLAQDSAARHVPPTDLRFGAHVIRIGKVASILLRWSVSREELFVIVVFTLMGDYNSFFAIFIECDSSIEAFFAALSTNTIIPVRKELKLYATLQPLND
jgi:hypothetical protein